MKKIVFFVIRLVLVSLLLMPTAEWFDHAYQGVLQLGVADISEIPFQSSRMLYLFFALLLATPGVATGKRAAGVAGGILLYLLIDRLMIPVWKILPYTQKAGPVPAKEFYTNVYYMLVHWMMPFLLWMVLSFREIEGLFRGGMRSAE